MDNKKIQETLTKLKKVVCSDSYPVIEELITSMGYTPPINVEKQKAEEKQKQKTIERLETTFETIKNAKANELYTSPSGDYICFFISHNILVYSVITEICSLEEITTDKTCCYDDTVSNAIDTLKNTITSFKKDLISIDDVENTLEELCLDQDVMYVLNFDV
jgi:hypothetical protein